MEEIEVPAGKANISTFLLLWKNSSFIEYAYLKARLDQRKLMSFCDGIFDHIHTFNSATINNDPGTCKAVKCSYFGGGFSYK